MRQEKMHAIVADFFQNIRLKIHDQHGFTTVQTLIHDVTSRIQYHCIAWKSKAFPISTGLIASNDKNAVVKGSGG